MTIEQALNIKQNWTAEQARNDLERWLLRGERPADKVIALACKALEKQIPKKVSYGYDEQDDIKCPNCETEIAMMDEYRYESVFYKHCPNCGQKLDWSYTK
mgnify:CR=1 FL=1